jgi:TIR domain-containing protein
VSTRRKWLALAIVGAGCAAAAFLFPVSPAISSSEALPWRTLECLLALGLLGGIGVVRPGVNKIWFSVAGVAGALTAASLLWHSASNQACLAQCNSREIVVGLQLQDYVTNASGDSNDDLLFNAGCKPERAWKPASIAACRIVLLLSGLTCIPLAALFGGSLIQASAARRFWSTPAKQPNVVTASARYTYDAFISYRHTEPDRAFALDLLERLEEAGFKVAFDERDFRPNEPVIVEMERCILNSRYTLCVVSPRYISSGFCSEEAEVCKTLDMEQRRRRLVPLFLERIALPAWFGALVGVDFASSETAFDPYVKLKSLLNG